MPKDTTFSSINPKFLLSQTQKEELSDFLCTVCHEIPFDPLLCNKCNKNYCRNCIIRTQGEVCVNCKTKCKYSEGLKFYNLFFKKQDFQCPHSKSGCSERFRYGQILFDHVNNCNYAKYACVCGRDIFIKERQTHDEVCERKKVECDLCLKLFLRYELKSHMKQCMEQMSICSLCGMNIKLKNKEIHMKDCLEVKITCEKCNVQIKKNLFRGHDCILTKIAQLEQNMDLMINKLINNFEELNFKMKGQVSNLEHRVINVDENVVKLSQIMFNQFRVLYKQTNGDIPQGKVKDEFLKDAKDKLHEDLLYEEIIKSNGNLFESVLDDDLNMIYYNKEFVNEVLSKKFLLKNSHSSVKQNQKIKKSARESINDINNEIDNKDIISNKHSNTKSPSIDLSLKDLPQVQPRISNLVEIENNNLADQINEESEEIYEKPIKPDIQPLRQIQHSSTYNNKVTSSQEKIQFNPKYSLNNGSPIKLNLLEPSSQLNNIGEKSNQIDNSFNLIKNSKFKQTNDNKVYITKKLSQMKISSEVDNQEKNIFDNEGNLIKAKKSIANSATHNYNTRFSSKTASFQENASVSFGLPAKVNDNSINQNSNSENSNQFNKSLSRGGKVNFNINNDSEDENQLFSSFERRHKQKLTWQSGSTIFINDINYTVTITCPTRLKISDSISVRVLRMSKGISIGLSNKILNENKCFLGLHFGLGNWGYLQTGYIGEEGHISKIPVGPIIKNNDLLTIYLDRHSVSFGINNEISKNYRYDFKKEGRMHGTDGYFLAVSLESLGDSVEIIN